MVVTKHNVDVYVMSFVKCKLEAIETRCGRNQEAEICIR
jgi:hypothetical protein